MTAEQKREQLLKRILPGLAITIIYFVFVSNMLGEKMKKAETDYKTLMMSGVSKDALPGILSQQQETQQQLTQVQTVTDALKAKLKKMAGFLENTGTGSNSTMAEVAQILDERGIKLRKDEKADIAETELSPALKEVWQAMKPPAADASKPATPPATPVPTATPPAKTTISVHHLWLKGRYPAMYQALTQIAAPELQVLPVTLTMQMPAVDADNSGEMEWELVLWM